MASKGIAASAESLQQAFTAVDRPTARTLAHAAADLTAHTPPKFLVGVSTVLRQAAAYVPAAEEAAHAFRYAYWRKTLHPDSWISDLLLAEKAQELKTALAKAEKSATADKVLTRSIRQEIRNIDTVLASLPPRGTPAYVPRPATKLGTLESALFAPPLDQDTALDPLRAALLRWQQAAAGFDADELRAARDDLCQKLGILSSRGKAAPSLGRPSTFVKAVRDATESLAEQLPDERALAALARLGDAVAALLKVQRAAKIRPRTLYWRHLSAAIDSAPNAWGRLGRKLASSKAVKASNKEAVKGLVTRVRAALAEAVGTASPAYRAALGRAMRRGEELAAALNADDVAKGVTPRWTVQKPHAALSAPGAASKKAGKLFVDDAVLVVNEEDATAYLLFAGQVKAGDATSKKAVQQLIDDQQRLFGGSITIGVQEYFLRPPSDIAAVQRVFVGTTRPSGAGRLTGLVEHIDAPLDAQELDDLAREWLRLIGKIVD